jgi:hypothetical protein
VNQAGIEKCRSGEGLHIQVDRDRRFILSGWGCNGGKGISAAGNCTT